MTARPRLLVLFSGAGGCTEGYKRTGFYCVDVDIEAQPRHRGDEFVQASALGYLDTLLYERWCSKEPLPFDAIHASPPCKAHTAGKNMWKGRLPDDRRINLVAATRELLLETGLPYVIENVVGAPMIEPVTICGTSLGLSVKRHRLFETNWPLLVPPCAQHDNFTVSVFGGGALSRTPSGGDARDPETGRHSTMQRRVHVAHEDAKKAMGIDWMTRDELSQAIPPAYTELIGYQLLQHIKAAATTGKEG